MKHIHMNMEEPPTNRFAQDPENDGVRNPEKIGRDGS